MQSTATDDATALNLLTRDGAIAVRFTPALGREHYPELVDIACAALNAQEMGNALRFAANRWGKVVEIN
jgi:hypothetical protein